MLDIQTPLILLGLAAPFIIRWSGGRLVATLAYVIFPLVAVTLYLPYLFFGDWPYIRFLLPAFPPLLAATAATVVTIAQRVPRPAMGVAAAVLAVSGVALHSFNYTSAPFAVKPFERRFATTGEYAQRYPGNTVFLALLHSGSLRYYTGRDILRWDLLDPRYLDTAVDHLQRLNYPLYLVVDPAEDQRIHERFPDSRTVAALGTVTPDVVDGVSIYRIR